MKYIITIFQFIHFLWNTKVFTFFKHNTNTAVLNVTVHYMTDIYGKFSIVAVWSSWRYLCVRPRLVDLPLFIKFALLLNSFYLSCLIVVSRWIQNPLKILDRLIAIMHDICNITPLLYCTYQFIMTNKLQQSCTLPDACFYMKNIEMCCLATIRLHCNHAFYTQLSKQDS